jgi:hypothetical protein
LANKLPGTIGFVSPGKPLYRNEIKGKEKKIRNSNIEIRKPPVGVADKNPNNRNSNSQNNVPVLWVESPQAF